MMCTLFMIIICCVVIYIYYYLETLYVCMHIIYK